MKELILLFCGMCIGYGLSAQTFGEWFSQDHTQLKYLAKQIAALKLYDLVLVQGYRIDEEELDSIGSIREDDLNLHMDHFAALDAPNAFIREDAVVTAIQRLCALLPTVAEEIEAACRGLPAAPLNWPVIAPAVADNLRTMATTGGRLLSDILTGNRYRMDDAGRLRALNEMRVELKSLYEKAMLLLAELQPSPVNPFL